MKRSLWLAACVCVAVVGAGPWFRTVTAQSAAETKVNALIAKMTLEDKVAMLHGATDPSRFGQAGYMPGVERLGIPPLRLTDGPAGVRTARPATAMPAPIGLAATFSPELARRYGDVMGREARALDQDVLLGPMVNIVRVPQAGRNFETLGEDPFLASRIVAAEIGGIQGAGTIATVKHYAENNQENARQSVSADVDERTMREIELVGFEAAVKAGVGSVMASYNKVNGVYASENPMLETDILRKDWGFTGFVMSDWGATHSDAAALVAGLDMDMPGGANSNFARLGAVATDGKVPMAAIDQAVRRILLQMDKVGLLSATPPARPALDQVRDAQVAKDVAVAGAVLLRNEHNVLPLKDEDAQSLVVIGPTAKVLLIGGGGSAKVLPFHNGSPLDALTKRAGPRAHISYSVGYDLDGVVVPASAVTTGIGDRHGWMRAPGPADQGKVATVDPVLDFTATPIVAGSTISWAAAVTAPSTGDYEFKLQTSGGRGSLQIDPAPVDPNAAAAGGRGARGGGGGRGGGAGLLNTADGLSNPNMGEHFEAGSIHRLVVTATADATTPMKLRLAWVVPGQRDARIAEAVAAAKSAHTAVVFAYNEGSEGRDRTSMSLPGNLDALIAAVAAVNPRTVVVLSSGDPILMPWATSTAAILETWYTGQEGADSTTALLMGDANPGGRLPETFMRRPEDAPTAPPERYPGVNGHGAYSEGIFVGYRWYDAQHIEPLFPFGYGLSYTTFEYSALTAKPAGDGYDVSFVVKNTGAREGSDVPQVYVGPPDAPAVPMATRSLAGFERVTLAPGKSQTVTVHLDARAWSYWATDKHAWVVAAGRRTIFLGASSRDIRLKTDVTVK